MIPTKSCEFRFTRQHNHAGVEYGAGDTAFLPAADAQKLRDLGAGEIVTPQPRPRPSPKRR